ncbi:DEAD/DEAH box helicase, partial [Bacteroides caccae]|uniref:DEAD/DEAH box helicase n=4 Tax=Pseudomonadati TaxID=3379134 RepID=UPI001230472D
CSSIAARQEKVILFTQFRSVIPHLHDLLSGIFGRPGLTLHGGTPIPERQNIVSSFQKESGPPFCILSLKAAGTGLTLTQASHVIHVDRWWNPAVESQATDRAYRIGQHRNVLVHHLICRGTIEDRIDAMLTEKRRMADDLFSGGPEQWLMNMSPEELKKLLCQS